MVQRTTRFYFKFDGLLCPKSMNMTVVTIIMGNALIYSVCKQQNGKKSAIEDSWSFHSGLVIIYASPSPSSCDDLAYRVHK